MVLFKIRKRTFFLQKWGANLVLFFFCFQAFFQRWWAEKSPTIQDIVHKLVDSGQLEFMYGT
jgi:hypothetical protein